METKISQQARSPRNYHSVRDPSSGRWMARALQQPAAPVAPAAVPPAAEAAPATMPLAAPAAATPSTSISPQSKPVDGQKWQRIVSNLQRLMAQHRSSRKGLSNAQLQADPVYQHLNKQLQIAQKRVQQSGVQQTATPTQAEPVAPGYQMSTMFDQGPTTVSPAEGTPSTLTTNQTPLQQMNFSPPNVSQQIQQKQKQIDKLTKEITYLQSQNPQAAQPSSRQSPAVNYANPPTQQQPASKPNWMRNLITPSWWKEQAATAA